MSPEDRKEYADRILNNPLWESVMQQTRGELQRAAEQAPMADHDLHQSIILSYQLLRSIESKLRSALVEGKVTVFNKAQAKQVI